MHEYITAWVPPHTHIHTHTHLPVAIRVHPGKDLIVPSMSLHQIFFVDHLLPRHRNFLCSLLVGAVEMPLPVMLRGLSSRGDD